MSERLISLRVQGFRCLEDVTVRLDGLQVFIGENGTGKSTLVEAFEILRRLAQPGRFTYDFLTRHGDIRELVRSPAEPLRLTAIVANDARRAKYSIELKSDPGSSIPQIANEQIDRVLEDGSVAFPVLHREPRTGSYRGPNDGATRGQSLVADPDQSALHAFGLQGPDEVGLVRRVLESLEVFPPIDVGPLWAQAHELGPVRTIRTPSQVAPSLRLARDGSNLASAFSVLGGEPEVQAAVLRDLRAGLGLDVKTVAAVPSTSPGLLQLKVRFGARDVPASQLSQGQLVYLALVAIKHLSAGSGAVVFDEPELHLHPGLLARAAWLLSDIAQRRPVVVATHADGILDALDDAARHVRVLTLDDRRAVSVMRLDDTQLARWRRNYSSLSELRRSGLLDEVLIQETT